MKIEQENEFKSLITEEKFKELNEFFSKIVDKRESYSQKNFYFEDEERTLNNLSITLRIREKNGEYELTAKLPGKRKGELSSSVEFNETITSAYAKELIEKGISPDHPFVQAFSKSLDTVFSKDFTCIGSLLTKRTDFFFYSDVISLDENFYLDKHDFELEWETENYLFAKHQLDSLGVVVNNAKGKRKRYLNAL